MGRSDRLYALVEELRARSPRLVLRHELAQRLEVGARTIDAVDQQRLAPLLQRSWELARPC